MELLGDPDPTAELEELSTSISDYLDMQLALADKDAGYLPLEIAAFHKKLSLNCAKLREKGFQINFVPILTEKSGNS